MNNRFNGNHGLISTFVAVTIVTLTACGILQRTSPPQVITTASPTFRISQADLFTGDPERLEPHLGLESGGGIRLEFSGPEVFIGLAGEIWEAGKPVQWLGSSIQRINQSSEAFFSLHRLPESKGQNNFQFVLSVVNVIHHISEMQQINQPKFLGEAICDPLGISEEQELAEAKTVMVWACRIKPKGVRYDGRSVEEEVRAARWALVIKAQWERARGPAAHPSLMLKKALSWQPRP
jgi:hypothetical protein